MSKADNMLSILWMLKTSKRVTAKQLAEALEINIRTVYRYIDALCASGVPIIADSGHNGGYSLMEQFNEAPLFFDLDEQKSLIHAAVFAQEAGYPFAGALQRAVSKLKRYTNEDQLSRINRHTIGFDVIQSPVDASREATLQQLELSVANGHSLEMDYNKGSDAMPPTTRRVDPYGLVYWKGKWYVVGYCHLRLEIRSFRVDRIRTLTRTEHIFERPESFSARQFFMKNLLPDTANSEHLVSVRIRGESQALNDLCAHWLLGHALVERTSNDACFKLEKEAVHTFVPYFLMVYGRAIRVIEPDFLKERMVSVTQQLLEHYRA